MTQNLPHIPVLLDAVLHAVNVHAGDVVVDATFGAGGYTKGFLDKGARVVALDRDPTAIKTGRKRFMDAPVTLHQICFSDMATVAKPPVACVVMDIGVSSMQLDQATRGFSFQKDAPLDMRMDPTQTISAYEIVNEAPEEMLADIFFHFGEERKARQIASTIVTHRSLTPITTTIVLAELVAQCVGMRGNYKRHPATQVFQALRIAVNNELLELVHGLNAAESVLKPGGVLAVVTFHSLEDRIVKRFTQLRTKGRLASDTATSRYQAEPARTQEHARTFKALTKRPITPTQAEQASNPRARSAKLRTLEKQNVPADKPLQAQDFDMAALMVAQRLCT